MFTIRKATTADCALIQKLAQQIFPVTYKDILTPEQTDYMMEWMYSLDNIRKQMEEEGHVYFLAYEECEAAGYVSVQQQGEDLFHLQKIYVLPLLPGCTLRQFPLSRSHQVHQGSTSRPLSDGIECKPQQQGTAVLRTYGNAKTP